MAAGLQYGRFERRMGMDELVPLAELKRRAIFRALRETGGDKLAAALAWHRQDHALPQIERVRFRFVGIREVVRIRFRARRCKR